jgi:hypothetical protein
MVMVRVRFSVKVRVRERLTIGNNVRRTKKERKREVRIRSK